MNSRQRTRGLRTVPVAVLALACALQTVTAAHAQQSRDVARVSSGSRLALVIGNDTYRHVSPLRNARSDARAIAQALGAAGFRVTLRTDLDQRGMLETVRTFKQQLPQNAEAVFYFAGHGVQFGGANYLLPVDVAGDSEEQVRDDSLPLQRVLDDIAERRVRFSLAIIDACRNNPFSTTGRSLGGRGLAPTTAATGQMVLYSAGSGQTALDRVGAADRDPNGLFTRVLLKEMRQPGLTVDRVLRRTRDEVVRVARSVGHEQVPALYDQTVGEFYFVPPGATEPSLPAAPPPGPAPAVLPPGPQPALATGGPAVPSGPPVFTGRFIGAAQGRLVEVELAQSGRQVTGRLDWAGSRYELNLDADGQSARGFIVDHLRDQQHVTTASHDAGQLTFRVQTVEAGVQVILVARER
jgi:hypothetical protein